MGRPSTEALAMVGADWARYCVDDHHEEDHDAPPEHLRPFEAFLETVVPADMVLAFGREEAAKRAHRGERRHRRSHREDVEEKLKLWAKAVAREATRGALVGFRQKATSPRLVIAEAREAAAVQPVLARPPGEPNSFARGGRKEGKVAQTLPGKGRIAGKNELHPSPLLAPSPRSGRRVEPCKCNQPLAKYMTSNAHNLSSS